jgi:hypothetical protein
LKFIFSLFPSFAPILGNAERPRQRAQQKRRVGRAWHFKRFKHGISGYMLGERRVDGGWHIAMSHQLHIALCTLPELSQATKLKIAEAYELLFAVHHALHDPLPRELVHSYELTTSKLL